MYVRVSHLFGYQTGRALCLGGGTNCVSVEGRVKTDTYTQIGLQEELALLTALPLPTPQANCRTV